VQKAFDDFKEVLSTRGQVLSKDGETRLIKYVGSHNNTSRVVDGVTYRVACDNLNTWIQALNRLIDLNAFSEGEYTAIEERQPEPVEESSVEELRDAADSQWLRIFGDTFRQWLASLARAPWNFVADSEQQRAALRYLERGTGDPLAFDNCRVAMSDAGVFPPLYTADELICKKLDSGEWDLSTPAGRSSYARAKNQVFYNTL